MSALERIAELHREISRSHIGLPSICDACEHDWPCPTRRLCDEAAQHHAEWGCDECGEAFKRGAEAGRDHASDECVMAEMAARADADRLAAALEHVADHRTHEGVPSYLACPRCVEAIHSALAAHDAARTKEGP